MKSHEQIKNILMDEENIRWQSLIYELVRSGKVDPWDIDLTLFANEYLKMIQKLKQLNFRLSGKVVLAAAILLKLKTNQLGLQELIGLMEEPAQEEISPEEEQFVDEDEQELLKLANHVEHNRKTFVIEPKLDGPRTRKVTVFELVAALKRAMDVDERRQKKWEVEKVSIPVKQYKLDKIDIAKKMRDVYSRLKDFARQHRSDMVEFGKLVPSSEKKDMIWTFLPLLHLAQQESVRLIQDRPFSTLWVKLKS